MTTDDIVHITVRFVELTGAGVGGLVGGGGFVGGGFVGGGVVGGGEELVSTHL